MSAIGRRPLVISAACLGLGLLAYQFLPRDETRITSLLEELCGRLNQTRDQESLVRLQQRLAVLLSPHVELDINELGQRLLGVRAVSERAADLLTGAPLTFALSSVEIHLTGRHLARVDADLLATVRGGGEQRRELRRTRLRLVKPDKEWQIEAVEIAAVLPSEPEARP